MVSENDYQVQITMLEKELADLHKKHNFSLGENSAIRQELADLNVKYEDLLASYKLCYNEREELADLKNKLSGIKTMVQYQVEDDGLWHVDATAPEAYLQQALRKLHHCIEQAVKEE